MLRIGCLILLLNAVFLNLGAKTTTSFPGFKNQVEACIQEEAWEKAVNLCTSRLHSSNTVEEKIWISNKLGYIFFSKAELAKAKEHYQRAYRLLGRKGIPVSLKLETLQNLVICYSNAGEHEYSMSLLKQALQLALHAKNNDQIKDLYNQLYSNYYSLGQLDSAFFYFSNLMSFKKKVNEQDLMNDWSVIGKLCTEKGDYVLAQRYLTKALREAELKKDTFFLMTLYTDIANIYFAQKTWENAYSYAQQGIELARKKSVKLLEAQNLKTQGQILYQQNKTQESKEKYEAALAIYRSLKNTINIADVFLELGRIYQKKEDYENAMRNIKEALAVRQGMSDAIGTLNAKLVEAEIELQRRNPQKAIQLVGFCLAQSQVMNHDLARRKGYLLLSDAYIQLHQYRKGYELLKKFNALNDTILSLERGRMINEIGVLYETEKKDNALVLQQAEIELQQNKIQKRNNQLLLLLSILGIAVLLLILIYINAQKTKLINEQRLNVMKKDQETQRLRAMIDGEEKERKRIARDLHDELGAVLATIKFQINTLEKSIPNISSLKSYQKAEQLIDTACATIREISHNMVPTILDQHGLEYAVNEICESINRLHTLDVEFISFGLDQELDDATSINLYRIIQELLRNVVNHAQANSVIVQLTIENGNINLIVEDDGKGFTPDQKSKKGIGLDNIFSRVKYLAGEVKIDSQHDKGSTFTIDIPIHNQLITNHG